MSCESDRFLGGEGKKRCLPNLDERLRAIEPNDETKTKSDARRLAENLISAYNQYSRRFLQLKEDYDNHSIDYETYLKEAKKQLKALAEVIFSTTYQVMKLVIPVSSLNLISSKLINLRFI